MAVRVCYQQSLRKCLRRSKMSRIFVSHSPFTPSFFQIWKLSDPAKTGSVGRDGLYKSLALTALAQQGKSINDSALSGFGNKRMRELEREGREREREGERERERERERELEREREREREREGGREGGRKRGRERERERVQ